MSNYGEIDILIAKNFIIFACKDLGLIIGIPLIVRFLL